MKMVKTKTRPWVHFRSCSGRSMTSSSALLSRILSASSWRSAGGRGKSFSAVMWASAVARPDWRIVAAANLSWRLVLVNNEQRVVVASRAGFLQCILSNFSTLDFGKRWQISYYSGMWFSDLHCWFPKKSSAVKKSCDFCFSELLSAKQTYIS